MLLNKLNIRDNLNTNQTLANKHQCWTQCPKSNLFPHCLLFVSKCWCHFIVSVLLVVWIRVSFLPKLGSTPPRWEWLLNLGLSCCLWQLFPHLIIGLEDLEQRHLSSHTLPYSPSPVSCCYNNNISVGHVMQKTTAVLLLRINAFFHKCCSAVTGLYRMAMNY